MPMLIFTSIVCVAFAFMAFVEPDPGMRVGAVILAALWAVLVGMSLENWSALRRMQRP